MKTGSKSAQGLPILVTAANAPQIQLVLDTIQGRAFAEILTASEVVQLAATAESALETAGIAATYRPGSIFCWTPSGPSANAYKYGRDGTSVALERKSSGWQMIRAFRITVWPKQRGRQVLTLTPTQKQIVLRLTMREYSISLEEARTAVDQIAKAA